MKRSIAFAVLTVALAGIVLLIFLALPGVPARGSTDDFYYKEPWDDYAPNGVPDFSQNQSPWDAGPPSVFCGPVAAANSLWWYDSKFESAPVRPPSDTENNDHYPLVTSEEAWDDHWPDNVVPFVDELAHEYFGTHLDHGTDVYDMYYGIQQYLYDQGLYDDYLVTLSEMPTIEWVIDEVMRSEDVILLLGFWQVDSSGDWMRFGGHYVTVAGVDPVNQLIAISDPYADASEGGWTAGVVGNGDLIPHGPSGHPGVEHNDAGNVSHDIYQMWPGSPSPGGSWWLPDYLAWDQSGLFAFQGVNPHPDPDVVPGDFVDGQFVHTEVEFAIAVSPFTWKRGEWEDYAPSCMPDFSQKQDAWQNPTWGHWSYCGPVAVANSLWWFDSKFEPFPVPPPAINDNYPLVQAYGMWDDHDPQNVESAPGTIELVDHLASLMGTDMEPPPASGTPIHGLHQGTLDYIESKGLSGDYSVVLVEDPTWEWVVEEVERSEDVVLLLGFWHWDIGHEAWRRYGGHYVTVAGVDPVAGLVGFSDPFFDQAELGWPWLGRVFPPGAHPPHPGIEPDPIHNDAAFLSHDVYHAVLSDSPGGLWGPDEYPAEVAVANFEWQNGQGPSDPVPGVPPPDLDRWYTEVEWAMAVSPKPADVWVEKTGPETISVGDDLVYTLEYGNIGPADAVKVTLRDDFPEGATYVSDDSGLPSAAIPGGRTWTVFPLGSGASAAFQLTLSFPPDTLGGTVLTNTFSAGATWPDCTEANNRKQTETLVLWRIHLPLISRLYEP